MASSGKNVLNFNVGVLGHIDSGKTSLAKALSTVASTASFDKNPQSKERGITLDLGFSSFCVPLPEQLKEGALDTLQYTLVDCPGHASLIRTIIGGAQIIDLMMLVVDVTKGVQTQTAECLVIGEISCSKMLVVLNKIDLLPEAKRQPAIDKMSKRLLKTLESTRFAGSAIVPVSAKPGGPEADDTGAMGVERLVDALIAHTHKPQRDGSGSFIFAVDHCFSIRGQGTVMTGTVLSGAVAVNDTIEIPSLKVTKKVKSMQMFKKSVDKASQGDRLGLCVTQFDPKQLERGLVCTPGALPTICAAIARVKKIPYFKGTIATKAKFHITMGHETVMSKVSVFGLYDDGGGLPESTNAFDFGRDYKYQDELLAAESPCDDGHVKDGASTSGHGQEPETGETEAVLPRQQFALLEFEHPVTCAHNALVIGSKLDTDIHTNTCRLAFRGQMLEAITDTKYHDTLLPKVKIYKNKSREGLAERMVDEYSVICRGLFKKESNIELFVGLKVKLSTGEAGVLEGGFGQSGKFKIRIPAGLSTAAQQVLASKGKKTKSKSAAAAAAASETAAATAAAAAVASSDDSQGVIKVLLDFKRYVYDPKKQMLQT